MLQILQNFKVLQMLQSFQSVENAAGLSKCCRNVNKCCKCVRFPKAKGEFTLLYLCLELIKTICSLLCFFKLCCCIGHQRQHLLCYVDNAGTLAFRDCGKCVFFCGLISTDLSVGRHFYIPHQPRC